MPTWTSRPRTTPALTADIVVVGAGAAGCALAARVAAESDARVLVVEDGPWVRDPVVQVPKGFVQAMQRKALAHRYEAFPVDVGPIETWLRGRGVGGSTLINGTIWMRGEQHLYDRMAGSLGPEWGWEQWRAAFEHLESALPVTVGPIDGQVPRLMLDALARCGVPVVTDIRRVHGPRAAPVCSTIDQGRRAAASRLLRPGLHAGTVRVLPEQRALRVVLERGPDGLPRATGVAVRTRHGETMVHHARRAVVLCAGTVETPLLLERSGIGAPAVLRDAGVDTVVPSAQVGEGLREQRAITVKAQVQDGWGLNHRLTGRNLGRELARYAALRTGPVATGPYDLVASIATRGTEPDVQVMLAQLSTDAGGLDPADYSGVMMQAFPITPTSTGSVHLHAAVDAPPRVTAPLVTSVADIEAAGRGLAVVRRVLASDPLARIVIREELPGDAVPPGDLAAAALFAHESGSGIYHAVGTCAAGPDEGAVVDPSLRVRGVAGLRVADLSAVPWHPSGGTAAVAMALGHLAGGWLVADLGVSAAAARRPTPGGGRSTGTGRCP